MTAVLDVVEPGLQTTVQDLGRFGFQALGVPVAGALDPVALRLANRLVGNDERLAALEIRALGPVLRVRAASVRVALCGTNTALAIEGPDGDRRSEPAWRAVDIPADHVIRVPALRDSATAYLAVNGGIDVPPLFGSRSTDLRGGLGGLEGRALRRGDLVPLAVSRAPDGLCPRLARPPSVALPETLRVVLGPQADWFTEEALADFLDAPYRVSVEADRMGLRLQGPALAHRRGYDLVSDAIATGAIQVPGSRQPILLLADHQTTGGYPKIATVISADLPAAGRLMPGAELRFAAVPVAEAEAARRAAESDLQALFAALVPAAEGSAVDPSALFTANLISGVVGGTD